MKAKLTPALTLGTLMWISAGGAAHAEENFDNLDLMDLMKVEVVSSSKFKQELSDVTASAYVITEEDIRDSGASNLPELLTMVPGLSVSESSANSWAVGIRGFNSILSNKVLVMIDGRSLFSPLFSGVFWEQVDLYLPDIERIEVIRGVGSTVWGANAVGGIINIITKSTLDNESTQFYLKAGDTVNYDAGLRFGAQIGDNSYARFYAKSKDIDSHPYVAAGIYDDWRSHAVGGKWEWFSGPDSVVVSGDWIEQDTVETSLITSRMNTPNVALENRIRNLSLQWQRQLANDKAFTVAAQSQQSIRGGSQYRIDDTMVNVELDASMRFEDHSVGFGVGFRGHEIDFMPGNAFYFVGGNDQTVTDADIYSAYIQDQWQMFEGHYLQIGTKFEAHRHQRSDLLKYDADLWLPTIRYRMELSERSRLWAALSRSARIPSISEHFIKIPIYTLPAFSPANPSPWEYEVLSVGNERFNKEKVRSFELGFRSHINNANRVDVVWFHNQYDDIRTFALHPAMCQQSGQPFPLCFENDTVVQDYTFENGGQMQANGLEMSWQSRINAELGLSLSYSYLNQLIDARPPNEFEEAMSLAPRHQLALQLDWQLSPELNLHLQHKYMAGIDDSQAIQVTSNPYFLDHYHMLDVNVSYDFAQGYRFMLGVDNLLDEKGNQWAPEFPSAHAGLLERRVFISMDVSY